MSQPMLALIGALIIGVTSLLAMRGLFEAFRTTATAIGDLGAPREAKPKRQVSAKDKQLMLDLLDGMQAQIAHEASLEEKRSAHPAHVRLVPQWPIRERDLPDAWFSGDPSFPVERDWPLGSDGAPCHFLAQLDCSKLPSGLWQGLGPRSGWLIVFMENNGQAHIIRSETRGDKRLPPSPLGDAPWTGSMFDHCNGSAPIRTERWPLDIVSVDTGSDSTDWPFG